MHMIDRSIKLRIKHASVDRTPLFLYTPLRPGGLWDVWS